MSAFGKLHLLTHFGVFGTFQEIGKREGLNAAGMVPYLFLAFSMLQLARRDLKRDAVRKSLVLLKNGKDPKKPFLPLDKTAKKILIDGAHADDLGYQCGGWTVTWTGLSDRITVGENRRLNMSKNNRIIGLSITIVVENHHHSSTYGDGLDNRHSNRCNRPIAMPTYGKLAEPLQ
ncbi:hypothetical protein FXO38_26553 [Capsicum annuum]|uniref:Uncharacterized protein n=1 Tax=Capsicum annuum TaxID=4072 RepID=A0A2G2YWE5_CAPAN|nr:hypothetical protein FXO38_26553 [Capsicum annuum]KAF3674220.1 hypothetical protein FXO37_06511 [Capsicum annuum]PHT74090.1 hypothetical protein T459_21367 [Capsicum annuum]